MKNPGISTTRRITGMLILLLMLLVIQGCSDQQGISVDELEGTT